VGPWFENDPVWGISPLRLLFLKSKLTVAGNFPRDAGILPERWLKERFSVPERETRVPISSGIEPVNSFADRSSWRRF